MNLFTEYVALDIGTHSLKALSLYPGAGQQGYGISSCIAEELPPGLVSGGFVNPTIRSLPEFSKLLQGFLARVKKRKDGLIIGLPDRWVKLHLVELALKPEEVQSSEYLSWKLKKQVCPPGIGEVLVDSQVLSSEEKEGSTQYRIMVGLVQKSLIDQLSHLFIDLHLEAMAFDTSTLGVYNLFEEVHPDRSIDRNLILCHIGHETTVVKIFETGALRYERVIEVGGEAFCKLFSEAAELPAPEAGKQIREKRFFPTTREDLLALISSRHLFEKIFGNWLRELHVTFRFYQDKFNVKPLPPIFLTGGSSQFDGLPEFLSEFFETPCQRFNPLSHLPTSEEIDPAVLAMGPQIAPCMGLLVR